MSAALQYFDENLPHRPYHTDDLAFGLRISGKGRALLARYIQQNQPHAQFWLVFDVDREGAAIDWSDRNAPAPNITVKNPVNGHAHLLYALNIAVRTAPDASVKALKYAAAVERSLCEKLCADVNYSGLICKNPFHLEWLVMEWREEAYTLDELADYLDLSASERRSIDKLCADVNYSGLICKNPFHLEWQVMEWREEAYTLDELADYLDLSASARRSIDETATCSK